MTNYVAASPGHKFVHTTRGASFNARRTAGSDVCPDKYRVYESWIKADYVEEVAEIEKDAR